MHRLATEHDFFTVGDFLEWRFDRSVRVAIAAILWIGTAALLAGQLIAMAWAFEVIAGLPRLWGSLLSALILTAYFSGGGLMASAWVNLLQLVVLVVGYPRDGATVPALEREPLENIATFVDGDTGGGEG